MDLHAGEHLVRIHRFRFMKASGCAMGGVDLVVEETIGAVAPGAARCTARPDHPTFVSRPEFSVAGESVEDALDRCLAAIRHRRFIELFLPVA